MEVAERGACCEGALQRLISSSHAGWRHPNQPGLAAMQDQAGRRGSATIGGILWFRNRRPCMPITATLPQGSSRECSSRSGSPPLPAAVQCHPSQAGKARASHLSFINFNVKSMDAYESHGHVGANRAHDGQVTIAPTVWLIVVLFVSQIQPVKIEKENLLPCRCRPRARWAG